MNHTYPVYTIEAECQDCYKCVRHCPVKAIQVRDGHAAVIPEMCVACGNCVEVCPVKAKQVRNGTGRARRLLAETVPVYVSLAPSWVSEFRGVSAAQLVRALKELGVAGVSETALGAQLVSAEIARELDGGSPGLLLSSACPTSVDFIRKYLPELAGRITPVASPLIAHCRLLRDTFGENIRTVFIGPCIAKKNESDRHPDLLNLALTYPELRQLFREEGIDPARVTPRAEDSFVPEAAEEGARYPIEGGMNDTIAFQTRNRKVHYVTLSGLENIDLALSGIRELPKGETVFVEMLACHGGCVHGPCAEHDSPGLLERLRVLNYARLPEQPRRRTAKGGIGDDFPAAAFEPPVPGINEIAAALRSIGKNSPEDELNCDGCGYDTCRNFAQALLAGRAEPSMCVSYLKKQAQKKANALLRSISSAVVITDKKLQIIECNRNFAALFGEDTLEAFDACPGLAGADLKRIVPFAGLFASSLQSGHDVRRDSLKVGKRLYNLNIFNIEPREVVGAVIFDVTNTEMRREQIAARAREVIDRNLATVQEIACRLGEQMADTELLLRSIADNYADETPEDGGQREKSES
ncbi:MAG TPA: [Fe-S]-binding protein [Lentisphaeria bacterium]|nr:[Fe-S]-binding protein [Lentisphaeria bacterium]HCG50370.1 [Fe-S]-binding protein [Lentisphaeria bacterium]